MRSIPSHKRRRASLGLALAAIAIVLLALAPGASAFKRVSSFIGSPTGTAGTDGGLFSSPWGIAINQTGAGGVPVGETYVADSNNRRIQEFDPSGAFVRAWGKDVIKTGAPNDTGTGFEICDTTAATPNVAADCKQGITGTLGGEFASPGVLAVDQATGAVYATDSLNGRIQKFQASGTFAATFGWDVVSGGATTFEICTVPTDCQAGSAGDNAGQVSPTALAVGPSGDLYVAEGAYRAAFRGSLALARLSAPGVGT